MTRVLRLEQVTAGYGKRTVLRHVSFSLRPGVTFLVGENGAGKSTLLRVLLGEVAPISGVVSFDGVNVVGATRDRLLRTVGYLPQAFTVPRHLRVGDFLRHVGWLRMLPRSRLEPAAREALATVGLADHWQDRLGSLSGGMVRRVGVAQAILHQPGILLLDEPTVGLDPSTRVEFRRLVSDLAASVAVLCSTHLLEDAASVGGSMIALSGGRVAFDGSTAALQDGVGPPSPGLSALESAFLRLINGGERA